MKQRNADNAKKTSGGLPVVRRELMREAKFWIEPEVQLANNYRYSGRQLDEIELLVDVHYEEILDAWRKHFGG